MKRFFILSIVALFLTGCANTQVGNLLEIATTPVTVTQTMVYQVENGLKTATTGLVGYRRLCLTKVIDPVTRNCRKVIETIQPYTRAAKVALVSLRVAVRENDQVTAINVYGALRNLINNIQSERQLAGVN